jgi:glycosyltransferase involved in cell wall biosynthesis
VKRALVLAYYYPPHGGAGVQRTVKFLKHLPSFGFEAVVVAGPAATSLHWAPRDETLSREATPAAEVRVPGPEPGRSTGWTSRAERWLGLPSRFSRWWVSGATELGLQYADDVDVVYATMSPFETAAAAAGIARAAGKPWVADLRDPWALDDWTVFPSALHRRLEERRMRKALERAEAVVLNTPEARRVVLDRFLGLDPARVVTIPNGWDREDFTVEPEERTDGAFRIVYVGYSHVDIRRKRTGLVGGRLAGSAPGLDALARSHVFLLDAVDALVDREPSLADRIEVHLAGGQDAPDARTAAHPLVRMHGYVSHPEAVALMRSADLLFLPMQDLPPGVRTTTVPGKTYEYLAARRPILGALPDGDARDLVARLPDGHLCRPRDVACMAETIRRCLLEPRARAPLHAPPGLLEAYERRELTGRLASVLDATIQGRPPYRGG